MNATFPVESKLVFMPAALSMSVTIIAPVTLLMVVRYVASGFNYSKTFEHLSLPHLLLILACVPIVAAALACLVVLELYLATITIRDGTISGRNVWGRRKQIPMRDITKITSTSTYSIRSIVVDSKYHGQIYISDKTQRLSELLAVLNKHLPDDQRVFPRAVNQA